VAPRRNSSLRKYILRDFFILKIKNKYYFGGIFMERTLISNLEEKLNENVKVMGWVHRVRKLSMITFLILRDRSGLVQCVIDPKVIDISGIRLESVVEITGKNVEGKNAFGKVEIQAEELNVISEVREDLPIEINNDELNCNIDTMLNNRVLSLRNTRINAIFKIQANLAQGFSEYLKNMEFTQVFSPKIVAEGAEGGTALFEIKYFENKAYLTQSPQFYKQMLVGAGYERVFEVGHVYRAEEHNTLRHLNEYVSLDMEMGFIEDEKDIMKIEESLLKFMINKLKSDCAREIALLNADIPEVPEKIPAMRLSEAIDILNREYGKNLEGDLDPEGERLIGEYAREKFNSEFLFLTHYPKRKRPMYTMPAEETLTHSFDLVFRGLEITTGGQRIHNYDMLIENFKEKGLDPDNYSGYLEVFKYGMPPHGGLAIGLERLTGQLLGLKNVRQACLFPRDRDRMTP
jgi:nondiscriminating aspartyl-tRNA synthetase